MAKARQYKISRDGHTYILTATKPQTPSPIEKTPHVQLNQFEFIYLVCPLPPKNTTHPIPEAMTPLLKDFSDVFQPPTGLSPPGT